MNYSDFYQLSRAFKKGALQVTSADIENEIPFVYGIKEVGKPLKFTYYMGKNTCDLIETGWVSLFLFSNRIFSEFEKEHISGWKAYPAEVYDKKGNSIRGYSVLGVTGRCGPIDDSLSEIIWKGAPVPEGNPYQARKGLLFDLSSWDRSGIFIPEGSLAIMVTKKVKIIIERLKATNFDLKPILEVEGEIF